MDFLTLLKEKAFNRYSLGVTLDDNQYKIANYHGDYTDQFFKDLAFDLTLPVHEKSFKFTFTRNEFKGFKNTSIQSFIRQNPSEEEFDNVFHSFYKHIPVNDLFNAVYIKSNYSGQAVKNSVYEPYITYFLKQDFNHQSLSPDNFIQLFHFNFYVTDTNYPDLKESLYTFLQQHVHIVRDKIRNNYLSGKHIDNNIKKFENYLYNGISKFIKPQDMKMFNQFWPKILIKSNNANMMTKVENTFVFDLNYSYLSDTFSQVTNEEIARDTCQFINNIINNHLNDSLTSFIIFEEPTHSRFLIQFHKNLTKESLPDIFDKIVDIKVKTNQFQDLRLRAAYQDIYDESLALLKKEVYFLDLNTRFPDKQVTEKKLKI